MGDWRKKSIEEHPLFRKFLDLFNTPVGMGLLLFVSFCITFLISKMGFKIGIILTVLPLGALLAMAAFFNAKAGFLIILTFSFFLFHLKRMVHDAIPFGAVVEVFIYLTTIGIFFTKYRHKKDSWKALNHPFTYYILGFFLFYLIQLFNPNMEGIGGWMFAIRKAIVHVLIYFIVIFAFDDKKFFKNFINVFLGLSFIAGVYGCIQEWFGFFPFENAWVFASETRLGLIYIDGHFRKFSILSDPTAFGVMMALSGTFCIIQMLGPTSARSKLVYFIFIIFIFLSMSYSGTRTAFAIVPASLVLFFLMTINNKRTLIGGAVLAAGFIFILFGPINNNSTINRIRSTFESDDPSLNVRDVNRAYIQPYIYEHPLGGGILTSGSAGEQYNPNHPLAGFPPDSGYLRHAIESGPIGLAYVCLFYFVILRFCIKKYYRSSDPKVKYYYLGFASIFFAITIAEYAQEVSGQMPCSILFYAFLGVMVKLDKVGV